MKHFCALDTPLLKKEEGAGGEVSHIAKSNSFQNETI